VPSAENGYSDHSTSFWGMKGRKFRKVDNGEKPSGFGEEGGLQRGLVNSGSCGIKV